MITMAFHFQLRYLNGVAHFWDFGVKKIFLRESSFNMTRGGGDEDIETRSLKF